MGEVERWQEHLAMARRYTASGLYHVAIDALDRAHAELAEVPVAELGDVFDEKGRACFFLSNFRAAFDHFNNAIECISDEELTSPRLLDRWVKYHIHLATVYVRLGEMDHCQRTLVQMVSHAQAVSPYVAGLLLLNLSAIQGLNGFYEQVIDSVEKSLHYFGDADFHALDSALYNNKGLAYLEIGDLQRAEQALTTSLAGSGDSAMAPKVAMARLELARGNLEHAIRHAVQALNLVWSSIINYEKEETAFLCHLLAQISFILHESELAQRLGEKAQVFYGQLGMWRNWQDLEAEMMKWSQGFGGAPIRIGQTGISIAEVQRFLRCLEALNAQELIHKKVSLVLDVRAHYARAIAAAMHIPELEREQLILASRFADYGLTALENDVVLSPTRSAHAFEQYKQHPLLSAQMGEMLPLSEDVLAVVLDHHEAYDGTGYPKGKSGEEIHRLARILSVADRYAMGVVEMDHPHSRVLADIVAARGTLYHPLVVDALLSLFG